MNSFMHDFRYVAKMMRATVRDEDDVPLGFGEKLIVAAQVLCGIIVIEHVARDE